MRRVKQIIKIFFLAKALALFASQAQATLSFGVGFSSVTSGQSVPSLSLQLEFPKLSWDITSTGYASKYDYLSAYTSTLSWPQKIGTLLGGDVEFGFGFGGYYTQRGFRDSSTITATAKTDAGLGPSFNVQWQAGIFFLRLQSLLGLGNANNLILIAQDMSHLMVGVRW